MAFDIFISCRIWNFIFSRLVWVICLIAYQPLYRLFNAKNIFSDSVQHHSEGALVPLSNNQSEISLHYLPSSHFCFSLSFSVLLAFILQVDLLVLLWGATRHVPISRETVCEWCLTWEAIVTCLWPLNMAYNLILKMFHRPLVSMSSNFFFCVVLNCQLLQLQSLMDIMFEFKEKTLSFILKEFFSAVPYFVL